MVLLIGPDGCGHEDHLVNQSSEIRSEGVGAPTWAVASGDETLPEHIEARSENDRVVAAYDNGTLVAPSFVEVGLAEGAVGYTTTGEHLGASTIATLEQLRDEIVNGTIAVEPVPSEAVNLPAHP